MYPILSSDSSAGPREAAVLLDPSRLAFAWLALGRAGCLPGWFTAPMSLGRIVEKRLIIVRFPVSPAPPRIIVIHKAFSRERFSLETAAMGVREAYPQMRQRCRESARNL